MLAKLAVLQFTFSQVTVGMSHELTKLAVLQPTFKKRRLELERVYHEACQATLQQSTCGRPAFKGCQPSQVHVQAQG